MKQSLAASQTKLAELNAASGNSRGSTGAGGGLPGLGGLGGGPGGLDFASLMNNPQLMQMGMFQLAPSL